MSGTGYVRKEKLQDIQSAGSMRKQGQTRSSLFFFFNLESHTMSLHSKMAASTPEPGKSIQ